MIRRAVLLVLVAGAVAVGCAAADGGAPVVSLRGHAPSSLVAGQPWVIRMRARGGRLDAVLARSDPRRPLHRGDRGRRLRATDGAVYVVESGDLGRPSGGIARVRPDGGVTRLRLVPRGRAT